MKEQTPTQQGLESIRNAWESNQSLSWEFIGQVLLAIAVIAITAYVAKSAKNFKDKL